MKGVKKMAKQTGPCAICKYFRVFDNKCVNPITILPNGEYKETYPGDSCPDFMPYSNYSFPDYTQYLNMNAITLSKETREAIKEMENKTNVPNDPVNHPSHYTQGKIECIDFIQDKRLNFCRGNAVKYIVRAGLKDPNKEIEDLKKAIWYLEHEIQDIVERRDSNEV